MNFIKKLTIKNFYSIKNEVVLNLDASEYTKEQHPYRLFEYENQFFNKLSVFYGANASGKTTVLRALVFVSHIISNKSNNFPRGYKNIYNHTNSVSFISIDFIFNDKEYTYKVEFLAKKEFIYGIKNESLQVKEGKVNKTLIDRNKFVFNDMKHNKIEGILIDRVSSTKSLLIETITRTSDYDELIKFFWSLCFLSNIKGSHNVSMSVDKEDNLILALAFSSTDNEAIPFAKQLSDINKKELSNFFFPVLSKLGIDIKNAQSDINIQESDKDGEIHLDVVFNITHSVNKSKRLNFDLESSGTKMLFKVLFNIFYAYKTQSILVIDELDSMVHPMIVPIINLLTIKNNIQLIYSTHNIHNLKFLYSDEFFLIEKDEEHNTEIKDPKKEYKGYENFEKLYEENLLGGTPSINGDFIWEIK